MKLPSIPSASTVVRSTVLTVISLVVIVVIVRVLPAAYQAKAKNLLGIA